MIGFLGAQLPVGCIGAVEPIREGDEQLLQPAELAGLERAVVAVRRASGAGRHLARRLCGLMQIPVTEIPRSAGRAPVWPAGIVGSISHDAGFAAAVVSRASELAGVGIDIEPCGQLAEGVARLVASPQELAAFERLPGGVKLLFSIKEAVFKTVHPRDQQFLEFHDVTVDLRAATATTRYGRVVQWRALGEPHILAIAWD
jgi:4'-phosphopantetheinyl transferase EntD